MGSKVCLIIPSIALEIDSDFVTNNTKSLFIGLSSLLAGATPSFSSLFGMNSKGSKFSFTGV